MKRYDIVSRTTVQDRSNKLIVDNTPLDVLYSLVNLRRVSVLKNKYGKSVAVPGDSLRRKRV